MKLITVTSVIIIAFFSVAWINPAADKVKEGNKLYQQGKYDDAMNKYADALIDQPDLPELYFNLGNTTYRKEQYEEAIQHYSKALAGGDTLLETKINYNIGNCKYRLGSRKENTDLASAIASYREALDHYKRVMELNPEDKDAKYNHEFIEKKIKELISRQQQQQQNQEEQQSKTQEQQESSSSQEKKEGEENKQGKQKSETATEQEEQTGKKEESGELKTEQEEKREMTPEEAIGLLDTLSEEEAKQLKIDRRTRQHPNVEKDW